MCLCAESKFTGRNGNHIVAFVWVFRGVGLGIASDMRARSSCAGMLRLPSGVERKNMFSMRSRACVCVNVGAGGANIYVRAQCACQCRLGVYVRVNRVCASVMLGVCTCVRSWVVGRGKHSPWNGGRDRAVDWHCIRERYGDVPCEHHDILCFWNSVSICETWRISFNFKKVSVLYEFGVICSLLAEMFRND